MKLTRAADYAIRCILFLAIQQKGEVVKRSIIAEQMDIPYQFLGKIGQKLAGDGLIYIVQGAQGGYQLAREPRDVTLLDAIEAVEGTIFLNDCVQWPDSCNRSPTCPVHPIWHQAKQRIREVLASFNFADLADQQCIQNTGLGQTAGLPGSSPLE